MAKAPFLLPTVFVGCPYSGKFKFVEFKAMLDRLPFAWYYADTTLKTSFISRWLAFEVFRFPEWNHRLA
jgi:hypothetical protein